MSAVAGAAAWPLSGAGSSAHAAPGAASAESSRWLELINTHTSETLSAEYRTAQGLVGNALDQLAHVLRDHRSGAVHPIDPALYDQLSGLAHAARVEPRFEIISGYRSPQTNARLAANSGGVAKHSLHMQGKALDIRLQGVTCARLRDLALDSARGGVGYYRASNFVHIDTGRVRAWAG